MLTAGCENDCKAFDRFALNLPSDSIIYADSIYTNYEIEDLLLETSDIHLHSQRKANSTRQRSGCTDYMIKMLRKKIETGFIVNKLKKITY